MELPYGFLTVPQPGDRALEQIHEKVLLIALRRLMMHEPKEEDGAAGGALVALQPALARLARTSGAALTRALDTPEVLGALLTLESGARPAAECLDLLPALLANLYALRSQGTLAEPLFWPAPLSTLIDAPGERAFAFAPPARALRADAAGLAIERSDGSFCPLEEATRPFHRLAAGPVLAELDSNPLALVEDHPDKRGNALDLGGRAPAEWVRALGEALALIDRALPTWRAELERALHRIVPVGYDAERHLSASYREVPTLAYLTLHPDPLTLAEAIVHETQHGKLNRLLWLDPVLTNGYSEWTESPVRPDLRPLMGVLLAVHAFVPVAALRLALHDPAHPDARGRAARLAHVVAGNESGLAVLRARARPTRLGAQLLSDLERLHGAIRAALPTDVRAHETAGALPG